MKPSVSTGYSGILPTDLADHSSPFETDRYVEEAINRAETGRRLWKILAVLIVLAVAVIAIASA